MAVDQLIWNNDRQQYYASLDEKRTLYVDGDAFLEAVQDAKMSALAEKYPEMSEEELAVYADEHSEDEDVQSCYAQAKEELLVVDIWENDAVPVDAQGERTDGEIGHYDAWIKEE